MSLARTFLAIGIAIIFAIFVNYLIWVVYEPPKYYDEYGRNTCYEDYKCEKQIQESCDKYRPTGEIAEGAYDKYSNCEMLVRQGSSYKACLTLMDKCNEEYQKTTPRYIHSRNTFFILSVIGIFAIIFGVLLTSLEGIGSGFIGGGVLVIISGLFRTWDYWFNLNKYAKLGVLFVVLILLIYLGYKKLEKRG